MLSITEYNDLALKDEKVWREPQEAKGILESLVWVSQKHYNILKDTELLPATNLIYVAFVIFDLVNCNGQSSTVNMFCRSVKPQAWEDEYSSSLRDGYKSSSGKTVGEHREKGSGPFLKTLKRSRWGDLAVLSSGLTLNMLVTMVLSCLFRKAECWSSFLTKSRELYCQNSVKQLWSVASILQTKHNLWSTQSKETSTLITVLLILEVLPDIQYSVLIIP